MTLIFECNNVEAQFKSRQIKKLKIVSFLSFVKDVAAKRRLNLIAVYVIMYKRNVFFNYNSKEKSSEAQ